MAKKYFGPVINGSQSQNGKPNRFYKVLPPASQTQVNGLKKGHHAHTAQTRFAQVVLPG